MTPRRGSLSRPAARPTRNSRGSAPFSRWRPTASSSCIAPAAAGLEVCRARSAILDHIIRNLWQIAFQNLSPQAQKEFPPIAVVALGGYGRSELNPHSDIDLMFLHEGQVSNSRTRPLPVLERVMNGVWLPLFDLGLKPGHSVRTIADCVAAANDKTDPRSMETKTSLIEARLIVGDAKLFTRFQKAVLHKCVEGYEEKYIAARLEDQAARRTKYGNSACMQEPNIKNGCGGLRDFQNLLWMAFFKYRTRSLKDLQELEFVTDRERKQLEAAYDFLLRVRTELHYHVNRATDVLTKNLQPAIAHNLGYTDRSPQPAHREVHARCLHAHRATSISSPARWSSAWPRAAAAVALRRLRAFLPGRKQAPRRAGGRLQVRQRRDPRRVQPHLPRPARAGSCACSSTPSSAGCACIPTWPSSSATSSRWWTAIS